MSIEQNEEVAPPEIISPEDIEITEPDEFIPGVKPNVAQAIKGMLSKGRRYFGSSGASLTHQVSNPESINSGIKPALAKKGLEGERSTTKMIQEWMKDKPGVVLVDSVHIDPSYKNSDVEEKEEELDEEEGIVDGKDTDHVLLIGDQVILIDSKRWKSKRKYSVDDHGRVLRSNRNFPGGTIRMKGAIYLWLEYLQDGAELTGIVHINADETEVFRNANWYKQAYRLVEKDRFIELLDKRWEKISPEDKRTINSTLVSQVVVSAIAPYDEYKNVFNPDIIKKFLEK